MPIYAYKCSACGHAQDILQKMSDPVLTLCPSCNASAFSKQVTAAGFQLKGSGWYVTDFRGGNAASQASEGGKEKGNSADGTPAAASVADAGSAAPSSSAPASATTTPVPSATPVATKTVAAHAPVSGDGA